MRPVGAVVPVLLSGGAGTRLWPLSREHAPKQLAKVTGKRTMLADTVARVAGLAAGAPVVVANNEHRFGVAEELRLLGVKPRAIVLEPVGRSTAPAVAVAALLAEADDPLLLVLPTDHFLAHVAAFEAAVARAIPAAEAGRLVVFGVEPTSAHTGYGWVCRGQREVSPGAWALERFAEKPDRATAERWLAAGGWAWNSGMFLFRASVLLAELERHAPDILACCRAAVAGLVEDLDFLRLPTSFADCRSESIDYALMERTEVGAVVPLGGGWSDLGSWEALWENSPKDARGNAASGDVVLHGATRSLVRSDHRLVVAVDVDGLLIVETADAVLVAPRSAAERVKEAVGRLREADRSEVVEHARVARPWGVYERLASGSRFQVKTIRVDPGEALSLQRHRRRAEHWVVVRGTALVRVGDREFALHENESTYIPVGAIHRLSNPGEEPLELVEVQTGEWLGEDDVERLDDRYGRR
jgi:mannose-1-phosphate guanylyltransferase/mannose-6-phosphate isomerase